MSVTASTDNFIQESIGPRPSIRVDGFVTDKVGIEHAWDDLPIKGDGFLMELLGVADIAEGDLIEGVLYTWF